MDTGQTADEPASPDKSPKDECMLVEEITHADDDTVLLYGELRFFWLHTKNVLLRHYRVLINMYTHTVYCIFLIRKELWH